MLAGGEIRHSRLVAADVAFKVIGSPGVVFVAVTVMLSTFGTLNGSIMTAPRIFFAMADDGLLFRQVAAVHPRFQTPYVAIVLNAALGVAFVLHARLRAARGSVRDRDRAVSRARGGARCSCSGDARATTRRFACRAIPSCR